ncbi:MAG: glycoside hydrolase [Bacteroidales bacterium]|nr:glycoside hydrolase [Bacteroidales bacterium]
MRKILIQLAVSLLLFSPGIYLFGQKKSQTKSSLSTEIRTIEADFNIQKGPVSKVWQECVGAGRANEGLRADWQEQLKLVQDEIGFKYIRMHGLLHDDMGVYFEDRDGNPVYNWQYIDRLYDFLLSVNIRPFVEISFMPAALASGDKTVFWWKGNITPPKSYDKWYDFMKAMAEHFTARYGAEEVKKWYFEVWNEPNLGAFFSSTQEEYFKLYDYTVKAIKSVNPDYRVGGPATAGNAWIPEMIDHCVKNNIPIDFISTHDYAVFQGYFDAGNNARTRLDQDPMAITKNVIKSAGQINASLKPELELHYTEWSSSYTPSDPIHDSYHSAAFILDKIKGTEHVANSMSYWVFTDIFEEAGPRTTPFHGGFGLLNYQDIKKPAYFAYQFLAELGNTELKNNDKASWVCKNEKGDVQILAWDFKLTEPEDTVNNQVYYKRDLPSKQDGKIMVKLSGIPEGDYELKITKVGYESNDAYASYMKMGSPEQLSKEQAKAIKEINSGSPYETKVVHINADKLFTYNPEIRENDVFLIRLEKL